MSHSVRAKVLFGGASCAAMLVVAAAPGGAQAPVSPQAQVSPQGQAQAAPAKAAKAPARSKVKAADKAQDEGEVVQAAAQPKKKDPVAAQQSIDAGIKLLQGGKTEQSIQTLTAAIAGGSLPPPQMARALYHRGVAYRKASKPAQAISDLTSALWLKNGLQDADRQDAVKQRADAYREAGLPDQSGEDGRPAGARQTAANSTARAASSGDASGAGAVTASLVPQAAPAAASTGGLFANLFGGFNKQAAAPAVAPEPKPAAAQPATSGWSSASTTTAPATKSSVAAAAVAAPVAKVKAAPVKTASIAAAAPAAAAPQAGSAAPGIHARIALVRTDAEAEAVKQRLVAQHAAALGGLAPTTSQAAFGGMGSFVQVRVGPYANVQQAQALCAKLKGSGLDCVPVDR